MNALTGHITPCSAQRSRTTRYQLDGKSPWVQAARTECEDTPSAASSLAGPKNFVRDFAKLLSMHPCMINLLATVKISNNSCGKIFSQYD